ncbi:MAG: hypothetical protein LBU87_00865 [Lactobacillales bacterium]|jgi:cell division transport system permease protein|nr:hypothetical protein [Lactobacillales bacterium]
MRKTSNIPFSSDSSRFFLPWMSMLMVFIAVLIASASMVIYSSINTWNTSLSGSLTVQIPTYDKNGKERGDDVKKDIETTLTILRSSEGVQGASVLNEEQMTILMTPWLGADAKLSELPLPQVIDVTLDPMREVDIDQIRADLKEQVPDSVLDSHRTLLAGLINLSHGIIRLTIFIIILLALTTSFTVIYSTRSSLSVHKPVISLVHMIGASDKYVAMQYALRSFKLTLIGSIFGFLLALPVMGGISFLTQSMTYDFILNMTLSGWQWRILLLIPLLIATLSFLTTFRTVINYLKQFL